MSTEKAGGHEKAGGQGYKPPAWWQKVRDDWISGTYATMSALGRAYGVSRQTLDRRRKLEGWDDERARIRSEARRKSSENLIDKISQVDLRHYKLWTAFDQQVALYLEGVTQSRKLLRLDTLDLLGRILERSQRGIRIAIGADREDKKADQDVAVNYTGLETHLAKYLKEALKEATPIQPTTEVPISASELAPEVPTTAPAEAPPAPPPTQAPPPKKKRSGPIRLGGSEPTSAAG